MKKAIAVWLSMLLCFSLLACGKTETGTNAEVEHTQEKKSSASEKGTRTLSLNEKTELDFVSLEFSSAALTYSVGGDGFSSTAGDGMVLFSLVGVVENTGNIPLPIETINAEMVFNGQYSYQAHGRMLNSKQIPASLAPLTENEYWIYAEIPTNLIDQLADCVVRFSFNKDFASFPPTISNGDYTYEVKLDDNICASAMNKEPEAFFKECPILPMPECYEPVFQTSYGSSSFNGVTSSISYSYSRMPGRSDNMSEVFADYTKHIQNIGFTVETSGAASAIYAGTTKLAEVSISDASIKFDIMSGNESIDTSSLSVSSNDAKTDSEVLKIGDTIETDYCTFTLDNVGTDTEIRSGSSTYGSYAYWESANGDPYYYLSGSFKNTGEKPVDIRNVAIQFSFDDKYTYRGEIDGVSDGTYGFITDVAPFAIVDYIIYAAVPQEVLDKCTTCQAKIGLTESFNYLVVDNNSLPDYKFCDDVFSVQLKG